MPARGEVAAVSPLGAAPCPCAARVASVITAALAGLAASRSPEACACVPAPKWAQSNQPSVTGSVGLQAGPLTVAEVERQGR
eukprot:scaffold2377_cov376-Prasinococcus_capsulatus_cf.AAC.6